MNNTEKTIKNSVVSVAAQIIIFLLAFVNRRIFIIFLDIEYLGYQSLFGNIFSILSVAELGIGQVISYQLYKEINDKNQEEIGKLMHLYKWTYRAIAFIVLFIGMICFCFLPCFVKGVTASWSYIRLIYLLQLSSIFVGYFLSYKRTMLIVTQQEYRSVRITMYVSIIGQILQLVLLAIFRNYIVYLCVNLLTTFIGNVIIAHVVDKQYPYLKKKYHLSRQDIENRNIFSDIGNFFIHKISYAIYSGTDNIIISAFCGIHMVALYGSYVTIKSGFMNIFYYKLLNPLQATIGNIVHSNRSKDELWEQFKTFDVFSFFFASYMGLGFLVFLQPVITLWLGENYLLSTTFMVLYSATIYLGAVFELVYKYRSVFGDFKQDRNLMMFSAVLNILISVVGAKCIGIAGVQIGTIVAFLPIAYGRIRFVVNGFFGKSSVVYILKHIKLFCAVLIEGIVSCWLTLKLPVSFFGFFVRGMIWLILPGFTGWIIYGRTKYFINLIVYVKQIIRILAKKLKRAR